MGNSVTFADRESRSPAVVAAPAQMQACAPRAEAATCPARRGDDEGADVWADEAAHRARNLAQLMLSAARVGVTGRLHDARVEAASLAAAYAELVVAGETAPTLDCGDVLARVARGLVTLCGQARGAIGLNLEIASLGLPAASRRALVLFASEVLLNAVKHAFPSGSGVVRVSLGIDACGGVLTIEDDGVGVRSCDAAGQGTALLDGLASVLCGGVRRSASPLGGLRVDLRFPVPDRVVS